MIWVGNITLNGTLVQKAEKNRFSSYEWDHETLVCLRIHTQMVPWQPLCICTSESGLNREREREKVRRVKVTVRRRVADEAMAKKRWEREVEIRECKRQGVMRGREREKEGQRERERDL